MASKRKVPVPTARHRRYRELALGSYFTIDSLPGVVLVKASDRKCAAGYVGRPGVERLDEDTPVLPCTHAGYANAITADLEAQAAKLKG